MSHPGTTLAPAPTDAVDLGLPGVEALLVRDGTARVTTRSVVVNLADEVAVTGGTVAGHLPARLSTVVSDAEVGGRLLLVVPVGTEMSEEVARAAGWHGFYGDQGPVLLRSPQSTVGAVDLDVSRAAGGPGARPVRADVRVNLWFSPAGTECGRHDRHPFLEIHTQVDGHGVVEKFHRHEAEAPYEEQLMAPGVTGASAFCRYAAQADGPGTFTYPWHQYRAITDATWLAVEYHLTSG